MNCMRWIAGAAAMALAPAFAAPTVVDYNLNTSIPVSAINDRIGNSRFFGSPNSDLVRVSVFPSPTPDSDVFVSRVNGQEFLSANGTATSVSLSHPSLTGERALTFVGLTSPFGGGRNEFTRSFNRAAPGVAALLDAWDATPFTISVRNPRAPNGVTEITRQAPDYDRNALPAFVNNVSITGNGIAPLLQWDVPASGTTLTGASIQVRIIDEESADGTRITAARLIHQANLPLSQTSFQFGNGNFSNAALGLPAELEMGRKYEISVQMDSRDAAGNLLGRSRTFFELTPLADSGGDVKVYLPSAGPDGKFRFDVEVKRGETIRIDPVVAIGYDYEIGVGDPLFRSVMLPDVGDGHFELWLDHGAGYVKATDLDAGDEYFFDGLGASRFRVLGIEPSAGLDPNDVTAFVTALTFAGDGRFTGTMTPIRLDVPDVVPTPGTAALVVLGLWAATRRRRASVSPLSH